MKRRQVISALPLVAIGLLVEALGTAPPAEALPRDRMAGRQAARASRQTGRQVSRARRRGYYGLPPGAAPFYYRGYRYYRVGPRFYYPYVYGGRTVYIDINVDDGNPEPPPSGDSIDIDVSAG
jgi:hypothetical protein